MKSVAFVHDCTNIHLASHMFAFSNADHNNSQILKLKTTCLHHFAVFYQMEI
jgi:hypothetical protein